MTHQYSRRRFIQQAAYGGLALTGIAGILYSRRAPAIITSDAARPAPAWGLQIGDVQKDRAIIWSRADKASRMIVDWSLDERFTKAVRIRGPQALEVSDFTARVDLTRLPPDADIYVRVAFEDRDLQRVRSEPLLGRFHTPPERRGYIRFVWSGDTVGQGWGIDLNYGGMKIYEAMRQTRPHFFIHSGDTIYADGPLQETVTNPAGQIIWTNAHLDAVPEKLKVAETLKEYRRHHLYNRYDVNLQRFCAEVPQIWQWDDHEVVNNWSDSKILPASYTQRNIQALTANATRAFLDYAPMRWPSQVESERIYRHIPYSRDLDVFVLDMRSYRGPNSYNRQDRRSEATAFLGNQQLRWLKGKLENSRATWKIIAADMPLGLLIPDGIDPQGRPQFEGPANGDGPVLGSRVRDR